MQTLAILSGLQVERGSDGRVVITQKFIDGICEYQKYWRGRILVFMEERQTPTNNLDRISHEIGNLPFELKLVDFLSIQEDADFQSASLVLASAGYKTNHISEACRVYGVPCVYVTEYSLKTRMQVIDATTKNPLLRLRRYLWEASQELKQRRAISIASGVQCNGTPTHKAYQGSNSSPLLYFDSRVTKDMLATEATLAQRTTHCSNGAPLRLLFSGRLIEMKGADHLILTAQRLKEIGVRFSMSICGDGHLRASMEKRIQQLGLTDSVQMLGVLEFKSELLPFVREKIDLFVCCHRQGDPSCTYLETMSCGVPIVGYANEAFAGLVNQAKVGWSVTMNRPDRLAAKIAELDKDRQAITDASFQSLAFATTHTFERTFTKRIMHLQNSLVPQSDVAGAETAPICLPVQYVQPAAMASSPR